MTYFEALDIIRKCERLDTNYRVARRNKDVEAAKIYKTQIDALEEKSKEATRFFLPNSKE